MTYLNLVVSVLHYVAVAAVSNLVIVQHLGVAAFCSSEIGRSFLER